MRVLCLGPEGSGKSQIINQIKHNESRDVAPTKGFNVTSVEFNQNRFTIWEVGGESQKNSWKQYSQNTQGLIYVVDSTNNNLNKGELDDLLEDQSLAQVPLLVYANKSDLGGNLPNVIENLGLNSVQDREWYCQGSDAIQGNGVNLGFEWLVKHIALKGNKSFSFDAEPRVVKTHTKYKQNDSQQTKAHTTFNNLMKDQRIIAMNPVQQESEYIRLEKERIKIENMQNQLINFKKNKKIMTPYDIRPSPNPRIEVNLEFFLTDHNTLILPEQNTTDCQTDEFLKKPPSPKYVPKKTGIDTATQVEDFELFDFNREVTPIVNVITTKTLEQSMIEIEQEEEIKKMLKFKSEYRHRREKDQDKWNIVLEKEVNEIQKKNARVNKLMSLEEKKMLTLMRVQSYLIGGQLLKNLETNCFEQLYNHGYYQNILQIQLKNHYIDWLVEQTELELSKKKNISTQLSGLFDKTCIPPLLTAHQPPRQALDKKKQKRFMRKNNYLLKTYDNLEGKMLYSRIFFNENKLRNSQMAKDFSKWNEGILDEYKQNMEKRIEELRTKLDNTEITEEEYNKMVSDEFPDPYVPGITLKNFRKIAFTLSHNMYYKCNQSVWEQEIWCLNKEGEEIGVVNQENPRWGKILRKKQNLRIREKKINDDECFIIDLDKIPEDVSAMFLVLKLNNFQTLAANFATHEGMQYARYGIEDWKQNIGIDNIEINKQFQGFDQYLKESEEPQSLIVLGYQMIKKSQGWQVEHIHNVQKSFTAAEEQDFKQRFFKYFQKSDGYYRQPVQQDMQNQSGQEDFLQAGRQSNLGSDHGSQVFVTPPHCTQVFEIQFNQQNFVEFLEKKFQELGAESYQLLQNSGFDFFLNFTNKYGKQKCIQLTDENQSLLTRAQRIDSIEVKRRPEVVVEEEAPQDQLEDQDQQDENND